LIQLIPRSNIETRAQVPQKRDYGIVRIGFDSIVDFCERQVLAQVVVVLFDHVQVDDETRRFLICSERLDVLKTFPRHVVFKREMVLVFHCRTPLQKV
jgi:hypothetical protein